MALGRQTKPGAPENADAALALGRQAVALGLDTLDLARMHEQAIAGLAAGALRQSAITRAEDFFALAVIPIIETHRTSLRCRRDLARLDDQLRRRTGELATAKRRIANGVRRRLRLEVVVRLSTERHDRMLRESLQVQASQRSALHRLISSQEEERKDVSRKLQEEIAQALMGMNASLIALKKGIRMKTRSLMQDIVKTQALAERSARSVGTITLVEGGS